MGFVKEEAGNTYKWSKQFWAQWKGLSPSEVETWLTSSKFPDSGAVVMYIRVGERKW